MAADNILAVFLLPFFGTLSDKANTRLGKRTPFIITGTCVAVLFLMLLPFADKNQNFIMFVACLAVLLVAMGFYRSPAVALMPDLTPKPLRSKANEMCIRDSLYTAFTDFSGRTCHIWKKRKCIYCVCGSGMSACL